MFEMRHPPRFSSMSTMANREISIMGTSSDVVGLRDPVASLLWVGNPATEELQVGGRRDH